MFSKQNQWIQSVHLPWKWPDYNILGLEKGSICRCSPRSESPSDSWHLLKSCLSRLDTGSVSTGITAKLEVWAMLCKHQHINRCSEGNGFNQYFPDFFSFVFILFEAIVHNVMAWPYKKYIEQNVKFWWRNKVLKILTYLICNKVI